MTAPKLSIDGRLFQARMWREYAVQWDKSLDKRWLETVLGVSRADCIRRARVNLYLARRLNRRNRK